ncbi:mesocentin-like [Condylostylus longicornis]|uniref:mesocentin-like n=1 Tax=Condylostylus longicornis TaxID=2530218 RepID=UPI00244DF1A8|nr:mesocentin-like [Condylostylus longicornis]
MALADEQPDASWKSAPAGSVPVRRLVLKPEDEKHRTEAPSKGQIPAHLFYRSVPDNRDFATEHRAEYKPKPLDGKGQGIEFGPDGVPIGVDPKAWKEYIAKHGIPPDGQIPPHLFYRSVPDNRDFATEHRAKYTPKPIDGKGQGIEFGPDGVPIGVDPKAWKEYIAKHGIPPDGQIPPHLFYQSTPDNRDFATEHRAEYKPKLIDGKGHGIEFGPDGVPIGVDPKAWKEYIAKHGVPPDGQIPPHLFYRSVPDNRDFATEHRAKYTPKPIDGKGPGIEFGPDGVPIGVDPKAWKEYIEKHGMPQE